MKLLKFFQQRVILVSAITTVFSLVAVVLIVLLPNSMFNDRMHEVELNIKELAENHLNAPEVEDNYNLFIYKNQMSTLETHGGFITNINPELETHLIMWSELQTAPTKYYVDFFDDEEFVYYITVVDDGYYVITFYNIASIHGFVESFKQVAGAVLVVMYISSIIVLSIFVNSKFILNIAYYDPATKLKTKYALYTRFHKKRLSDFDLTYIVIENLAQVIEACGVNYRDMIRMRVGETLENIYLKEGLYQLSSDSFLILSDHTMENTLIEGIFNKSFSEKEEFSSYQFKMKVLTIKEELIESMRPEDIIKRFEYAYGLIRVRKVKTFRVDERMLKEIDESFYYSNHLEEALDNDWITNHYQMKVDPITERPIGCESLSRWDDGEKIITPINYIGIAEASGMIRDIDIKSFRNSCRLLRKLKKENLLDDEFRVSTNFSPITLKNINIKALKDILEEYEVDPKHISVEITESIMIEIEEVSKILKAIKELGMTIEIDDFSAGNSSLGILPILNANTVKIDMAVLPDLNSSKEVLVYDALVSLSKQLGLKVVSEGVETIEHVEYLKGKVDAIQGYFYSKPLDVKRFVMLMREYNNDK